MARHYLGDAKLDLPAHEIFAKWRSGSPAARGDIAAYAAKDTELPLRLLDKLCVLENTREMANATSCPMRYIFRRGQQIKVYSQLLKKGRDMGCVFPDNAGIGLAPGAKFAGAVVLEARKGAYFEIVSCLDFASLYPSIIRAHNLSPDTLVMDARYDALEGTEYYEVATDQGTFRFAQQPRGILPSLLEDLAAFRKRAKADMAAAKARGDAFATALFNAKQLAFKVSQRRRARVRRAAGPPAFFFPCHTRRFRSAIARFQRDCFFVLWRRDRAPGIWSHSATKESVPPPRSA